VPVRRPKVTDTTALGVGFFAGLGPGVWGSTDELIKRRPDDCQR
jgi:glycerol kinase